MVRVGHERLQAGKYVVHKEHHFQGFEIWSDGTCIRRATHKTHVGKVEAYYEGLLQSDEAVFQLVPDSHSRMHNYRGMDVSGGSVSRTPSPSSVGDARETPTCLLVTDVYNVLGGWIVWTGEPPAYMPVSLSGFFMCSHFLTAVTAAHWFVDVALPELPQPWVEHLWSLPSAILSEILLLLSLSPVSSIDLRARLYLTALLGMLELQVPLFHFPEEGVALYKYVWPKASLKQCLARLGYKMGAAYHELQCLGTVNEHMHSLERGMFCPWPASRVVFPGCYIINCCGVFSALKGSGDIACWTCGDVYARVPAAKVTSLSSLREVAVYSLHRCADRRDTNADVSGSGVPTQNVQLNLACRGARTCEVSTRSTELCPQVRADMEGGGLETHPVSLYWAYSGTKICEVSIVDDMLLDQVRSALASKLGYSMYCIEILCEDHVVQSEDAWHSLGAPTALHIILVPETEEHAQELMAAIREGDEEEVTEILKKGQTLRVAWHEENDNLLLYTCRFKFSETIALTLIANGADVNGEFEGYSLLHYCVVADWVAAGKALVERGAQLQWLGHGGGTCLHMATSLGRLSSTQWLLAEGMDPLQQDQNGDTPFSLARNAPRCTMHVVAACAQSREWKHILVRNLDDFYAYLSDSDLHVFLLAAACLQKQKKFFLDEDDALGGSYKAQCQAAHGSRFFILMETMCEERFRFMSLVRDFCEVRVCNKGLHVIGATLERGWELLLQRIFETHCVGQYYCELNLRKDDALGGSERATSMEHHATGISEA